MMKRSGIMLFLALFLVTALSAQNVDREELEKNLKEVEFINYQGPHETIETRKDIMSVGESLAGAVSDGSFQGQIPGKYRILHLLDPSEPDKIGADIIIIESGARVDHIRNLRLIIAAYLGRMYGYGNDDSMLLAEFVTYYNAVYRGNIDFFSGRYINRVMTNISRENAGIDINYKNWPGNTRLVIPLKSASSAAAPDPFELAEKDVIEDLRKDEGMGIEQRKKIVELQEESVTEDKKALAVKEAEIAAKGKATAEREKVLEEKKKEIEEKEADPGLTTEEKRKLEEAKKETEREKAAIDEEKGEIAVKKAEAEEARKDIEKKEEAVSQSRESVAEDSNKLLEKKVETAAASSSLSSAIEESAGIPFLRLEEGSQGRLGKFVFFSPDKGSTSSPAETPVSAGRLYVESEAGYIVPVRDESGKFTLVLLSAKELLPAGRGGEEVPSGTYLLYSDNSIYCIAKQSDKWVVARYTKELKAQAFSDIEADPDTFIVKKDSYLLFQDRTGIVVSVNADTLKAVTEAPDKGLLK